MTISIRRATLGDTRAIVDFNLAMARESEARELDPALLEAGVQHMLRQPARASIWWRRLTAKSSPP